jgi:hypothetical protein
MKAKLEQLQEVSMYQEEQARPWNESNDLDSTIFGV